MVCRLGLLLFQTECCRKDTNPMMSNYKMNRDPRSPAMRVLLLATAAIAAIAATAPGQAADVTVVPAITVLPAYRWSGFYAGAQIGGAWGIKDFVENEVTAAVPNTVVGVQGARISSPGFIGGGQIGYNWMAAPPNWLLGVEADITGAHLNGSVQTSQATGPALVDWTEKINAIGTIRSRLGFVANNWLFYITGGWAWTDDKLTRTQLVAGPISPAAGLVISDSPLRTGWTVGGGFEWGFAPSWTAKLEYLHVDLGRQNFNFTTPIGPGFTFAVEQSRFNVETVRVGVNFLFN
jgi:outer membrane immunogenic protein